LCWSPVLSFSLTNYASYFNGKLKHVKIHKAFQWTEKTHQVTLRISIVGLTESLQRGQNRITQEGKNLLSKHPDRVDNKLLKELYQKDVLRNKLDNGVETDFTGNDILDKTPEEIIGIQSEIIKQSLVTDLLSHITQLEPDQFEQLVVDLLLAMGYGGTVEDAGSAIGQSSDGGIDGMIKEDVLGLDTIYLQEKRWKNTVPIKEIRDFAGALLSKRSNKGVFITTSNFPLSAHEFVATIDRKIILIDGKRLAELMIQFNLGVSIKDQISIKEIDMDYFTT
jgi:restriction system protein